MDIADIQRDIENLYEVKLPYAVTDFLITDRSVADALSTANNFPTDERLFIRSAGDTMDISLFIDEEVLERLKNDDPTRHLHADNVHDYLVTLEGVSHFVYLAWNAHHDRAVTLMELELQAEVDKYVQALTTLLRQADGHFPYGLRATLFEHFSFNPHMDQPTRVRYRDANNYAHRYCQHLEKRFREHDSSAHLHQQITADLRRFYRMSQAGKIRAIQRVTA